MDNMTVREWVQKFENGEFDATDRMTQRNAGWVDYFCSRDSLAKRLKKMGNIIKDIKSDYILDNYRVWFKNNCPCCYPLYDDFRFEPNQQVELIYLHQILYGENWTQFLVMFASENTSNEKMISGMEKIV